MYRADKPLIDAKGPVKRANVALKKWHMVTPTAAIASGAARSEITHSLVYGKDPQNVGQRAGQVAFTGSSWCY